MSSVVISGNTSGAITLSAPDVAGTNTITLPASTGYLFVTPSAGTLGVSSGGTGITTTTAYGILAGGTTSTGAFQNAGVGTSGQVLTSNGPGVLPSFQALPASGGQLQTQIFTAPGTWTKPASTTLVKVTVVGGGGGLNGAPGNTAGRGGAAIAVSVPVSAPVSVTVGSGGVYFPTTSGSTSSFGALVSATGGGANPGPNTPGTGTVSAGTALLIGNATTGLVAGSVVSATSSTGGPSLPQITWTTSASYSAGSSAVTVGGGVSGVVIVEFVG